MNAVSLDGRLTYAVAGQVDWLVRLLSTLRHCVSAPLTMCAASVYGGALAFLHYGALHYFTWPPTTISSTPRASSTSLSSSLLLCDMLPRPGGVTLKAVPAPKRMKPAPLTASPIEPSEAALYRVNTPHAEGSRNQNRPAAPSLSRYSLMCLLSVLDGARNNVPQCSHRANRPAEAGTVSPD